MSALDRATIDGPFERAGQATLALRRLLAGHDWHPWWQVEQVAGVFIDPRIAGRRYIRGRDQQARRRGSGRSGLAAYQEDPDRAERVGKGEVLRKLLIKMGAERRGAYGAAEYRLPPPRTGDADQGKGGGR